MNEPVNPIPPHPQDSMNKLDIQPPIKKFDRHNQAKLKILHSCLVLEKAGQVINSVRLAKLIGKTVKQTDALLYKMAIKYPYLGETIDRDHNNSCSKKYYLKKEGRSVYQKLLSRFQRGLDLNLSQKNPKPVKFL